MVLKRENMNWIDNPIFLCGHRKSGTTLLLSLFDNHPNLNVYPPDSGFWYGYYPRYEESHFTNEEKSQRAVNVMINNFKSDLENLESWKSRKIDFDFNELIQRFKTSLPNSSINPKVVLDTLMTVFFEMQADQEIKKAWMEKTTSTEIYAIEAANWYKNAKFIHLIRDPRDNFASLKSGWEDRYVDQNDSPERLLQSLLERGLYGLKLASTNLEVLGSDRYKVVKFEDLVNDSEFVMKDLCGFLNIDFDKKLLIPTYFGLPWKGNNFDGLQFSKASNVNVDRWKERIDEHEAKVIEYHGADLMEKWGYSANYSLKDASEAASKHYKWHNFSQFYSSGGMAETYKK